MSGSAGSESSAANSIPSIPSIPKPRGTTLFACSLEDAELGRAVGVEGAVPVEVVGLEVEKDGDVAGERVDVLELEARELAHDPRILGGSLGGLGERPPDVAGDLDGTAGGTEDRAEQLGRRRLPIRAGDADEARPARQQSIAELDLAPDRDSARVRGCDERRLRRNARALHQQIYPFEQRLLLRSETKFDAEAVEPAGVDIGRAIGRDDVYAAPGQCLGDRTPRPGEPDDERAARQPRLCGRCSVETRPAHGKRSPQWGAQVP